MYVRIIYYPGEEDLVDDLMRKLHYTYDVMNEKEYENRKGKGKRIYFFLAFKGEGEERLKEIERIKQEKQREQRYKRYGRRNYQEEKWEPKGGWREGEPPDDEDYEKIVGEDGRVFYRAKKQQLNIDEVEEGDDWFYAR